MRFLVDRCAGRRLAEWLRAGGHDVLDAREFGTDPGDKALLERAAADDRVLITLDTDFGELIYLHGIAHAGLRLPDVPMRQRMQSCGAFLQVIGPHFRRRAHHPGRARPGFDDTGQALKVGRFCRWEEDRLHRGGMAVSYSRKK